VWTRWEGTKAAPSLPISRAEHYFPDIDDPRIILAALIDFNHEWDDNVEKVVKLEEFRNTNTDCGLIEFKKVIGTSPREYLDKKFFFRTADALEQVEDTETEIGDGDPSDIYMWTTSAPDELHPTSQNTVRADSILGIMKIGKLGNRNLP